jgi:predicted phosphodiesterase
LLEESGPIKIRVLSDLHLEFEGWCPPTAEADVVVLAGDIHCGTSGLLWARETFPHSPIVYVPGNHEYYGRCLRGLSDSLRETANSLEIALLNGDEVVIGGVRLLGATLWTDFALHGSQTPEIARAMADAKRGMNDFNIIKHPESGIFLPEQAREIHLAHVQWIEGRLLNPFDGPTVVVSHHLPHPLSIHARYRGSCLNPAFASDLSRLLRPPVALWIHGHTHESCDYVLNGVRVMCNPRGYLPREPNPDFDPLLVATV